MASDYQAIREENERRYGTDIGRIGPLLLSNRYDDRTHFIYELLQNAEDAFARGDAWTGSRSVKFVLSESELKFSHYGAPFNEDDVRGICGIAESSKDLGAIGRFGIGFKSVYAFADRPEIHSGTEDFAVETYVWPTAVAAIDRDKEETVFILPLRAEDQGAVQDITEGLIRLGPRALLFLRQIEEIFWEVEGGRTGLYLRSKPEGMGEGVRRIVLLAEEDGVPDTEETWLVFSRPVVSPDGVTVGHVEIAFAVQENEEDGSLTVLPLNQSPLVVYFPTVLETNLGFLVQGPYRTTPSRDNIPRDDPWNRQLVEQTGELLVEALCWLRDHEWLDVHVLECLPLDGDRFLESSVFAPLYEVVRKSLSTEHLLPRFGGGYIPARIAMLGRTQELRELLNPDQLGTLFEAEGSLEWLSEEITLDRTPELRRYVLQELDVDEVAPVTFLSRLNASFLEGQADDWLLQLYEFLNEQRALLTRYEDLRLVRLEDGSHVVAFEDSQPQAFLPSTVETDFPTVRRTVCATKGARAFLECLGLSEPDPVDDVIRNVLTKYQDSDLEIEQEDYDSDIQRILTASASDSKAQREKLIQALRTSKFVRAVDAGDGTSTIERPEDLYLATERFKELFAGVRGVLLVDGTFECLRGERVRELLKACGATRSLASVAVKPHFSQSERRQMRAVTGSEGSTGSERFEDFTLRGLDLLLEQLAGLDTENRARRAGLLWEALVDLETRRGTGVFSGTYYWFYFKERSADFDAAFVRSLNETAWIPDAVGDLELPEYVIFDSLGWKPNPFLLSKIRFKPPLIDELAREAGIEPGVLDLLKKLGVTSEEKLRERLGIDEEVVSADGDKRGDVEEALKKLLGETPDSTPPPLGLGEIEPAPVGGVEPTRATGDAQTGGAGGRRTAEGRGARQFISYVGLHPNDQILNPDGLDQEARMALEAKAIEYILEKEPDWQRMSTQNPGFDLYTGPSQEMATRWCEVKAMSGSMEDWPVGLSRAQFEFAREHGEDFWLYVVEHASHENARLVRIQDPAGKARTFTFDHGWRAVAQSQDSEDRED